MWLFNLFRNDLNEVKLQMETEVVNASGGACAFCMRALTKTNLARIIHMPFNGQYVKLTIPITISQQQQNIKTKPKHQQKTIKPDTTHEHTHTHTPTAKTKAHIPREYFLPNYFTIKRHK